MYTPLRHIPDIFVKRRPVQLTYFVTNRCNAKCPYCFYLQGNQACANNDEELSLNEIQSISRSLDKLLWLAFSGGEIFLRNDLPEISRIFYDNNNPVYILYPTNGSMPGRIHGHIESILKHCRNSVVVVKLSMDGLYDKHDKLRNTPGSFEKTMQTYQALGDLKQTYPNLELGVNTVFCAQNQDDIQEIIDYASTLKHITTHTLSLVRGDLKDKSYQAVDMSKYWYYTDILAKRIRSNETPHYRFKGGKLKIAQDIFQRHLIRETFLQRRRLIPCFAGRANLVLTENGEVYPCESFSESFGNVRNYNYDLTKLMHTDTARHIVNKIENNCCYCTHECYFITNIMLNAALYPAVVREYLKIKAA